MVVQPYATAQKYDGMYMNYRMFYNISSFVYSPNFKKLQPFHHAFRMQHFLQIGGLVTSKPYDQEFLTDMRFLGGVKRY